MRQFWAPTIVSVTVQIGGWSFLKESECSFHRILQQTLLRNCIAFPPVLLERKAAIIKKSLGPEKGKHIRTVYDGVDRQCVTGYRY